MQPLLYIVVRRTTDWTDDAGVRAQLPSGFEVLVDLWNDTFEMPYHRFRQELKRIAADNHAQVAGAACTALEEVPVGGLIAPVDDDDWFAPDVAQVLAANRDDLHKGYRWPSRFLEVPPDFDQWLGAWRRYLIPSTPLKWLCTTNNHAIENMPGIAGIIDSHIRATEWFVANEARVKVLDVPLSLQNRNIASQTALLFRSGTMMTRARLARRLRQYRRLYRKRPRGLPEWCAPWIERMRELMAELRLR